MSRRLSARSFTLVLAPFAVAALLAACAQCPPAVTHPPGAPPVTPAAGGPADAPPAAAPQPANPYAELPNTEWPANYQTLTIKVSGMTCPIKCVREVKDMLTAVPGVLHVRVDYDEREAVVDVVPGTDPQTVLHGLTSGYSGRLM